MKIDDLYGVYEVDKVNSKLGGEKGPETSKGGMFTFTRDGKLCVVNGSSESIMCYSGTFKVEKDIIEIQIEVCNHREMDGTRITRKILKLDSKSLVLEAIGVKTGRLSVFSWNKIVGF